MKTKQEIIEELKIESPTIKVGNDQDGYVELSTQEYETMILERADARLAKQAQAAEAEAKAQAKAELLERLGITADEAKLLLS
jgi:hypothetical protein